MKIDLDKTLFVLFCCYAFSLAFELIFEIIFGIDTVFKPFRIFSLLIIGVFGIKVITKGIYFEPSNRIDLFLYAVYFYGLLISLIRMIEVVFDIGYFVNDVFQILLFLSTFFIFKILPFSKAKILTIFHFFIAGVSFNSLYTIWKISQGVKLGRNVGFYDNPNYCALGIVGVIVFLSLRLNYHSSFKTKVASGLLLLFLFNMFGIAGSRGALVSLVVTLVLIFIFINLQRKLTAFFLGIIASVFFLFNGFSTIISAGSYTLIHRVNRSLTTESGGNDPRFVIWKGVFRTLEDQGYAGLGIGQFKANFVKFYGEESNKMVLEMVNRGYYLSPHNDYLYLLTDYGLPSLLFYLIFLALALGRLSQELNIQIYDEKKHFLVRFNFILLIGLIVFGLTTDSLLHPTFWFLLMFSTKHFNN